MSCLFSSDKRELALFLDGSESALECCCLILGSSIFIISYAVGMFGV